LLIYCAVIFIRIAQRKILGNERWVTLSIAPLWPVALVILLIDLTHEFSSRTINLIKIINTFNDFKKNEYFLVEKKYELINLINDLSSEIKLNGDQIFSSNIEDIILLIDELDVKSSTYFELFYSNNFKWVKKRLDYDLLKQKTKAEFIKTKQIGAEDRYWVFHYQLLKYDKGFDRNIEIDKDSSDIRSCLLDEPRVLYSGPLSQDDSGNIGHAKRIEPKEIQDWQGIFASDFKKAVKLLDKNLQGRVFSAILEILESPLDMRGDTLKPLTAELKGAWRYRLGDYRLVYLPSSEGKKVIFLDIGARGGIYH